MIKNHRKPSDIQSEHVVLVIAFEKSFVGPHMASDKKYYIRAGAHTGAAGHFLVEAIRARRNLEKPLLIGIIKPHSRKAFTLELEILAANDAPAFDVALDFSPLPLAFQKHAKDRFPIHISVIDKTHPFSMEISLWGPNRKETFGEDPVEMKLKYKDNIGKEYQHVQVLDIREGVGPMRFGDETIEKIEKSIDKLQSEMKWFRQDFNRFVTSNSKSKNEEQEIPANPR